MNLSLASTSSVAAQLKVATKADKIRVVEHGDTLSAIAKQERIPLKHIINANPQLLGVDKIFIGDNLKIPYLESIASDNPADIEDEPVDEATQEPSSEAVTPQDSLKTATDEAADRVVRAEKIYYDASALTQSQGAAVPYLYNNLNSAKSALDSAVTAEMQADVESGATEDAAAKKIQQRYVAGSPESEVVVVATSGATAQIQADAIVMQAKNQSDPQKAVQVLNDNYINATPEVQQKILINKDAQTIIQRLADYTNQPLSNKQSESVGEQVPGRLAMQNLNTVTSTLDKNIVAQVVMKALPKFEAYALQYQETLGGSPLGSDGIGYMMQVLTRIEGTTDGTATIQRLAKLGIFNENGLTEAVANGASPAYIVELAKQPGVDSERVMNTAFSGMAMLRSKTNDDALAYGEHMQEVAWLVANHGGSMTPEQLDKAIVDYNDEKGADWRAKTESLKNTLVQDGTKLLQIIQVMKNLPSELSSVKDQVNEVMADTLNDPKAYLAITTALQQNPALTAGKQGESLLGFLTGAGYVATPKLADQIRKLTNVALTGYVKNTVFKQIGDFNPNDPASVQRAQEAVEQLRNSNFARVTGLSGNDLDKTINALKNSIPVAGESAEKIAERSAALNKTLQGIKALDKSTLPGQLIRGLGLALAGVGFLNSVNKAATDPSLKNSLKAIVDSAGLGHKKELNCL
jgi:LysM domain